ncbi:MAG TPA: AMP-binding protein [Aquabacterium sp.]|nr:AMP-binding protein [Aquabacterium sp.]
MPVPIPQQLTTLDCLYRWEQEQPDAVYLTQPFGDRVVDYTWREVADQVRRMAAYLQSLKLPAGSNIGILSSNCAHWVMADLAVWMAGHVTVPLYPTVGSETANYVLEHSQVQLLFVGKLDERIWEDIAAHLPPTLTCVGLPITPSQLKLTWNGIVERFEPLEGQPRRSLDAMASIIYTSGSTGQPKGAMISFRAMWAVGEGLRLILNLGRKERMLSYLPLAHAAERACVETASLYFGFHVYFANSIDTFVEDLRRARPTIFFSVPRLWTKFYLGVCDKMPPDKLKRLLRIPLLSRYVKHKVLKGLGLEHVKFAITASAPLAEDLVVWYRSLGLELLDVYGMTENFAYSHASRPGMARPGYVGNPNPGVACRIAESGEIQIKSPGMMMGYYRDDALTQATLTADGYLKTGDCGEVDAQGRLRITGRLKDNFKTSRGKYVAPVPIENKLAGHPKLEAVCVMGANLPQPVALLMLSQDAQAHLRSARAESMRAELVRELTQLIQEVNATLESHEQLAMAVIVQGSWTIENGYLTPTLKIKRNVIEQHYQPLLTSWMELGQALVWESEHVSKATRKVA